MAAIHGRSSSLTVLVTNHANATLDPTYTAPMAQAPLRNTSIAAPRAMTLSGDVAEFAVVCLISPQWKWYARFLAYDSVMYASSIKLRCTIRARRAATAPVPRHTAASDRLLTGECRS